MKTYAPETACWCSLLKKKSLNWVYTVRCAPGGATRAAHSSLLTLCDFPLVMGSDGYAREPCDDNPELTLSIILLSLQLNNPCNDPQARRVSQTPMTHVTSNHSHHVVDRDRYNLLKPIQCGASPLKQTFQYRACRVIHQAREKILTDNASGARKFKNEVVLVRVRQVSEIASGL